MVFASGGKNGVMHQMKSDVKEYGKNDGKKPEMPYGVKSDETSVRIGL